MSNSSEEIGAMIETSMEEHPVDTSDPVMFSLSSWGLMTNRSRAAWLAMSTLGAKHVVVEGEPVVFRDGRPVELDANLLVECERNLDRAELSQYVKNCLSEASAIAYKGLSGEAIKHPDTAFLFYSALITLPIESRALCMYWAIKGADV